MAPAGGSPVKLDEPYVDTNADGTRQPTKPEDIEGTDSWTVPAGMYFVMGDHRDISQDSRFFGPISRDLILGRAWLRYFPLDRVGIFQRPTYAGLDAETGAGAPRPPAARLPGAGLLGHDPGVDRPAVVEQRALAEPQASSAAAVSAASEAWIRLRSPLTPRSPRIVPPGPRSASWRPPCGARWRWRPVPRGRRPTGPEVMNSTRPA